MISNNPISPISVLELSSDSDSDSDDGYTSPVEDTKVSDYKF